MGEDYAMVCSNPSCSYGATGICMDGHTESCQFLSSVVKDEQTPSKANQPIESVKPFQLSSNDEILEENLNTITDKHPCNLILLVGEPECGKSTLYASLFDRFHKGQCGDYYFAGTRTPLGFEKKCHHARVISQNITSITERTLTIEFSYLHLSVRHKSLTTPIRHLLFADVNGEKFQSARNSDDEMRTLTVLKRATHICFVADGDVLMDTGSRHQVKIDMIKVISRALQNGMIDEVQGINFLITKWDKIQAAGSEADVTTFFIKAMKTKFGSIIKEIIPIASRSKNENFPAGSGVDDFLKLSLSKPAPILLDNFPFEDSDVTVREFQNFKYRLNDR